MNICGCLVHATLEAAADVRLAIEAIGSAEVHTASDDGRFVVVVEDTATATAADQIMAMHQIPGVISVTLNYHHFEDLSQPAGCASSQAGEPS